MKIKYYMMILMLLSASFNTYTMYHDEPYIEYVNMDDFDDDYGYEADYEEEDFDEDDFDEDDFFYDF